MKVCNIYFENDKNIYKKNKKIVSNVISQIIFRNHKSERTKIKKVKMKVCKIYIDKVKKK